MKRLLVFPMVAFIMMFAQKTNAQSDTNNCINKQIEIAKAIDQYKSRTRDAGLMHILGGTSMGLGLGALAIQLKRNDMESRYAMYGFSGVGVCLNISAGILHLSAGREQKTKRIKK